MSTTTEIPTSARSHQSYCKKLDLDLASLKKHGRILDVASGLAEFVSWNLKNGIYAVGVDSGYDDIGMLVGRYLHHPLPETEEGMVHEYGDIVSDCSSYDSMVKTLKRHKMSAARRFLGQYPEHDRYYQEGDCFDLEFPDDHFDLAVNVEMIGRTPYFTVQEFYHGFKEMFRVAKEIRVASRKLNPEFCETPQFRELTADADVKVGEGLIVVTK